MNFLGHFSLHNSAYRLFNNLPHNKNVCLTGTSQHLPASDSHFKMSTVSTVLQCFTFYMQFFLIANTKICAGLNSHNLQLSTECLWGWLPAQMLCPSPIASYSSSWLIVPASLDLFLVAFLISPHHSSWTATLCFTNQSVIFSLCMAVGVNCKEFFPNSPSVVLAWQIHQRFYFHHHHSWDPFHLSVQEATFHLKKISELEHDIVRSSPIPSHLGLHLFSPESHPACTCCLLYVPSNRAIVLISSKI